MPLARITFNAGNPLPLGKLLATWGTNDLDRAILVLEDMPAAGGMPIIVAPGQELVVKVLQVEGLGEVVLDVRQSKGGK